MEILLILELVFKALCDLTQSQGVLMVQSQGVSVQTRTRLSYGKTLMTMAGGITEMRYSKKLCISGI